MSFTRPQHLVETDWMATHLDDPGVRVLECTVFLAPGRRAGRLSASSPAARSGRRGTSRARASSIFRRSCPIALASCGS